MINSVRMLLGIQVQPLVLMGVLVAGLAVGSASVLLIGHFNQPPVVKAKGLFNVDIPKAGRLAVVDQEGQQLTWASFSGTKRLVYFGYTHCPDICPLGLSQMMVASDRLAKQGITITSLFVTIDPERDGPAILKEYTGLFGGSLTGLNAQPEQLATLASVFKVQYRQSTNTGETSDYLMNHTDRIFFADEFGEVLGIYGSEDNVADEVLKIINAK